MCESGNMRVNRCVVTVHPGVYKVRVKNTFKRKTSGGRELRRKLWAKVTQLVAVRCDGNKGEKTMTCTK